MRGYCLRRLRICITKGESTTAMRNLTNSIFGKLAFTRTLNIASKGKSRSHQICSRYERNTVQLRLRSTQVVNSQTTVLSESQLASSPNSFPLTITTCGLILARHDAVIISWITLVPNVLVALAGTLLSPIASDRESDQHHS